MVFLWSRLSVFTLRAPPVFALGVLYLLLCVFSFCLDVGSLSLIFLIPFEFSHMGFAGLGSVIMTGLNCAECLGALSGPLFFTLRADSISHLFVFFFSEKN